MKYTTRPSGIMVASDGTDENTATSSRYDVELSASGIKKMYRIITRGKKRQRLAVKRIAKRALRDMRRRIEKRRQV